MKGIAVDSCFFVWDKLWLLNFNYRIQLRFIEVILDDLFSYCFTVYRLFSRYFTYRDSLHKKTFLISTILVIVSILPSSILELSRNKRVLGFGRAFNGLFAILGIFSLQQTAYLHTHSSYDAAFQINVPAENNRPRLYSTDSSDTGSRNYYPCMRRLVRNVAYIRDKHNIRCETW